MSSQNAIQPVLIVHSSGVLSNSLPALLRGLPFPAAGATNPEEAQSLFHLLQPQLVLACLSDAWLPVLEKFRSEQPLMEMVGLTHSEGMAQKARSMGIDNVVLIDDDPGSLIGATAVCLQGWPMVSRPRNDVTVLVVDDDIQAQDTLVNYLVDAGYSVRSAHSGLMALEILDQDKSVLIVLLDVVMPEMGGIETLNELKGRTRDLGVIMTSIFADRQIVRQAFSLGAFDFLLKPLDLNQLECSMLACLARLELRSQSWWKRLAARPA